MLMSFNTDASRNIRHEFDHAFSGKNHQTSLNGITRDAYSVAYLIA